MSPATGAFPPKRLRPASFTKPGDIYDRRRPGARLQLSVEHGLLRRHQDPAGADAEGLAPDLSGEGKADDPRDPLRRPEFGFDQRRSRSLQAGQSRPGGREPVRSHAHQEGGSFHQGPALGARPAVRHDPHGSAADSSGGGRHYVCGEGRTEGQGRQDQVRRQQEHQDANSARGDEESEADRRFRIPSFWKASSPRPTTRPSWKKTPSGCGPSTRTAATSRPGERPEDRDPRHRAQGRPHSVCYRRGRARRSILRCRSTKATSTGWARSRSRTIKRSRNTAALRILFPLKDGDVFSRDKIAKGLENLRKAYGEYRLHQLHGRPLDHV